MTRVAVVTVGRSDYGILRPVLKALEAHPDLDLALIAAGMHLAAGFGETMSEVAADGFAVAASVALPMDSDDAVAIARASGYAVIGFADAYARLAPAWLLLLGDRFETHAAATAAVPFALPIAHLHGGEITEGATDEQYRHAITKLSHLHFVATNTARRCVAQMGEEPWRIVVSGAPALDNMCCIEREPISEVSRRHGIDLQAPFVLVTYHPETLGGGDTAAQVAEFVAALETIPEDLVITAPAADAGYRVVRSALEALVARRPRAWFVPSLGTRDYFSLMARAAAVAGNSSSGIIEAPSFAVPVVNVGDRQRGRLRAANVIDAGHDRAAITAALARATAAVFRASLAGLVNPYGDGHAAERIVTTLASTPIDQRLRRKRFHVL